MMSNPKEHSIQGAKTSYKYLVFDSVFDFNTFIDVQATNLSVRNTATWEAVQARTRIRISSNSDWYGTPSPKNIEELEAHRTFLGMPLIKKIQPKIKDTLERYMVALENTILPMPKIAYNARGLGVFSFDRAAMGMYKNYPVNLRTPIDTSISQMGIALDKYAAQTSVKNVYAHFQDKEQSYPSLQLFIMSGANGEIKGNALLYVGLACAELVEFMELRGVSVEVNILMGTSFRNQVVLSQVRLKRYQDKLDKNQLLLMSSDPRYFRYRGFKSLIAMSDYLGLTIPSNLGRITSTMGTDFTAQVHTKGFVFEQSYSIDSAVREVIEIIEQYSKQLKK